MATLCTCGRPRGAPRAPSLVTAARGRTLAGPAARTWVAGGVTCSGRLAGATDYLPTDRVKLRRFRADDADLDVRVVWGATMALNRASQRVMEKVGMAVAQTLETPEDMLAVEGSELGGYRYEMTKERWAERRLDRP